MSEQVPATPPVYDEATFHTLSLTGLHIHAMDDVPGEPLVFLAAQEVELCFMPLNAEITSEELLAPEVLDDRIRETRELARLRIGQLAPTNEVERQKKEHWLADIDNFGAQECLNFRLYQAFSVATLGPTAPPKGASYDQMIDHEERAGWLEFRFGTDTLQEGYYDYSKVVSEIRFNPCPPEELLRREAIVGRYVNNLAIHFGLGLTGTSPQLNLSVYSLSNGEGNLLPVIGYDEARTEQTLDVVTGLGAAVTEGLILSGKQAANPLVMRSDATLNPIVLNTHRANVRIHDDYVELHDGTHLQGSTAHGLLWMMAGTVHGLRHGREALAAQGHTPAELAPSLLVEPTGKRPKAEYIKFRRALESATIQNGGRLEASRAYLGRRAVDLTREVLGPDTAVAPDTPNGKERAQAFGYLFMAHLTIGGEGRLSFSAEWYRESIDLMIQGGVAEETAAVLRTLQNEAAAAEAFVGQDALRARIIRAPSLTVQLPARSPQEWFEAWNASPLMELAYGQHVRSYAAALTDIAVTYANETVPKTTE